jgi:hypothetical protein
VNHAFAGLQALQGFAVTARGANDPKRIFHICELEAIIQVVAAFEVVRPARAK